MELLASSLVTPGPSANIHQYPSTRPSDQLIAVDTFPAPQCIITGKAGRFHSVDAVKALEISASPMDNAEAQISAFPNAYTSKQ